jgi:two-component system response regulator NreC
MESNVVRILIVDDHEIYRHGIRVILEREPAWIVCGEATSGHEALNLALTMQPDVVILDIGLPDMSGLEVLTKLHASVKAHVLILTVHDIGEMRDQAMKAGASGWVLKSEAADHLTDAVHEALGNAARTDSLRRSARSLSSREREVLRLLSDGKSNKEVGVALGIATKTVETHRTHIMEKLRVHGLAGLVRYAIRNRIVEP